MAEVRGKLMVCDRCGKEIFLKCTGEGETDGGFTRWSKFEDEPPGWKAPYLHIGGEALLGVGQLCPECNQEYQNIVENFKSALKMAHFTDKEGKT